MEHVIFVVVAAAFGWACAIAALELVYVVIAQKIRGSLLIFYFFVIGVIVWTLVTVASPAQTSGWGVWEMVVYRPAGALHAASVWGGAFIALLQFLLFGPREKSS